MKDTCGSRLTDIPFIDLKAHIGALQPEIMDALARVCASADFSGGTFVEPFERQFAEFIGAERFAGVSNGSDALLLALRALGIGSGDEVILPASTFIATAFAPMRLGAVPVFADCDPVTWQIDPVDVERRITRRTRAVIGVHLYGQAFPLDEIRAIAAAHGLKVLEDCAQSQGTLYRGRAVGALSDAGSFSFYPTKNLGACGQAGGVACADEAADRAVRVMRAQGAAVTYLHDVLGYNMRMDGMQAAILSVMLPKLPGWNARRAAIVAQYREGIHNPALRFQGELDYTDPAWYLCVVCVDDRDAFMRHMKDRGIACGIHYRVPCHLQKAAAHLGYRRGDLPNAEYLADHCVSLPLFPELTEQDVERVIEACDRFSC